MYRFLLPLSLVALGLPAVAQAAAPSHVDSIFQTAPSGSAVEPSAPLTLQAALTLSLQGSAELSAFRHELQAVEASILQAGVRPNPSVSFEIMDSRRQTRETTLQFSQPIEAGGKRAARVRAAEGDRDLALADLNAKAAEIRAAVITTFFDVLAAQERLRLAQDSAELARGATNVAAKRVVAGRISPVEETKARVAEAGVRIELIQARSALASSRKRLAALWGNLTPRFERADGQFDAVPNLPDLAALTKRLAAAPGVIQARSEVGRRQAMMKLELARRTPDVTVHLGAKRSEELGRNQMIIGVSLPLPLFDRNDGNVLQAIRRVDKASDVLTLTEIRLDGELTEAYANLDAARQAIAALKSAVLPGAQSAYDAASKGFEFGKFNFLDVLDAQRTLLQAKSHYLNALSEAHHAAAEIDRVLGQPLLASER